MPLTEDAFGDKGNALFLMNASDYAYLPPEDGVPKYKAELDLDAKFFAAANTQAYVCSDADDVVLAFRGSEAPTAVDGLKDWLLTNANNLLVQPVGPLAEEFVAAGVGARWHQGFVTAVAGIWDGIFAEVSARQKEKERCFWITGHSLGGSLAVLAAWLFARRTMKPHQVYTFGGPMVGNKAVADALDRQFSGRLFRYVNGPDPVPLLPMISLAANDFTHSDRRVLLGTEAEAADLFKYLADAAGGLVQGLLTLDIKDKVWGAIMARVNAHLPPDYRKLLG